MGSPLQLLWNGSLAFLALTVAIVAFPFTLAVSASVATIAAYQRHKRRQREAAYAWPLHDGKRRQSGYRRARYGRLYR